MNEKTATPDRYGKATVYSVRMVKFIRRCKVSRIVCDQTVRTFY